ncbi:MAG: hypothetical protein GX593_04585 [Actinomycetales bacterium]|nr:hypothetical protein [Actinomycetales bacterium]
MTPTPPPRHRLAAALWTLVVPVGISLAGLALTLSWRDRLPDPIVTHWGPTGADGFGTLTPHVVAPLAVMVPAFSIFCWAFATFGPRGGAPRRSLSACAVGFSILITGVFVGGLAIQLDLEDAALTGDVGGPTVLSLFAAIAGAGIAAWLTPGSGPTTAKPGPATPGGSD